MCPFGCGNSLQRTSPNTAICRECGNLVFAVDRHHQWQLAADPLSESWDDPELDCAA
jgi:hypothetical protein